jgi:hypothetical protein
LMYRIYVRRQIEAGLEAADRGELISHEEVFAEFESGERSSPALAGSRPPRLRPAGLRLQKLGTHFPIPRVQLLA